MNCLTQHSKKELIAKFTRVLPILKPQPAKSLLTVAYKLNNEDIDEDRLRK